MRFNKFFVGWINAANLCNNEVFARPLKFCLKVTAPTTRLPMPISRRVSGVLAKGTGGRSDFDLIWVERRREAPRGGRLLVGI